MTESIESLDLLPCDSDEYLPNLIVVLKAIDQHVSKVSQNRFIPTLELLADMDDDLITVSISVCHKLKLIEIEDDLVVLSDLGRAFAVLKDTSQTAIRSSSAFTLLLRFLEDHYTGFLDIIVDFANSLLPQSIQSFENKSYDVEERITWLLALGLLKKRKPKYALVFSTVALLKYDPYPRLDLSLFDKLQVDSTFEWTEDAEMSFGEEKIEKWIHSDISITPDPDELTLKRELREASSASNNPNRFKTAIAETFRFLGYEVEQFGDKGFTDVVIWAKFGGASYRTIVVAKCHKIGSFYDLEPVTLLEHQILHEADYVVVVARQFGSGQFIRQATANNIVLLPLTTLETWIDLHLELPQSIVVYKAMFEIAGKIEKLPNSILEMQNKRKHLIATVSKIIDLLEEGYAKNMSSTWTYDQIYSALNILHERAIYSIEDIKNAVDFICHPLVDCARCKNGTVFLTANRQMLRDSLGKIKALLQA